MRVTMTTRVSGTRDGERWPPIGDTIDLPTDEAEALIDAGLAEPAGKPHKNDETTDEAPKGEKRRKR
ncbi:MAG TPA: hypothetical protein VFJ14_17955 [Nocardioidaceae bacterium]|nr:hypothetical protein [Nocardioidaceae bacterium]